MIASIHNSIVLHVPRKHTCSILYLPSQNAMPESIYILCYVQSRPILHPALSSPVQPGPVQPSQPSLFQKTIHTYNEDKLRYKNHKLKRSKLSRSILRCLLTTPSLKNRSSPVAVRPPIYHFSADNTSLNPSEELSEPLLTLSSGLDERFGGYAPGDVGPVPGDRDRGDVECARGE
jgi:hypothetical protein